MKSYTKYADLVSKKQSKGEWMETWGMIVNPENTTEGYAFTLVGCPLVAYAQKYGYMDKDDVEFYTVEIAGKDKKGYSIKWVSYYKFGYIKKLKPDNAPQIGDQVILTRFKNEFSLISDKRD